MLKKVLIAIVVLPLICCLLSVAGAFFYASSQKEKNILKVNLLYLSTYDYTDYLAMKDTDEAKITTEMPINVDEPVTVENEPTLTSTTIDVPGNKATVVDGTTKETTDYTLDEYVDESALISDYNLWADVIDEGKYKVTDDKIGDQAVWKYTLDDSRLTQDFMEVTKKTFEEGLNEELGSGNNKEETIEIANSQIEFNGKLTYEIYISKDDYKMKKAVVTADKPVVATFELTGKDVDTVIAYYKSIGKSIDSVKITMTFENLKSTREVQELKLKNGKSVSKNPILLYKDAFVTVEK